MIDENAVNELVRRKVVSDTFRRLNSEKKEKLYRLALALFGKYGYDGLSVDQYCDQGKISKGSFFQYFPSKTHLLEFSLLLFDSRLEDFIDEIMKDESKVLAKERLKSLIQTLTARGRLDMSEKIFYLFAANALHHSAVTVEGINITKHVDSYIEEIVKRGTETGEIRRDYQPEITGAIVSSALHAVLIHYFLRNIQPDDATVQTLISILFDGIRA
ncbi:MAG TPA: TetR/AcrR family transcriptional regulator [candidate division Zixibacteria bacterium]|nr:TetR/AcrR family transcriptional regulator [candidate division Zixibacteria bacterium]